MYVNLERGHGHGYLREYWQIAMRCEYIGIYWGILHPWNILQYCALLRNIRRYWRNIFQPNTGIYWSISRRRQAPQSFRNILQYTAVYPNIFTACLPHYWLILRYIGIYCCILPNTAEYCWILLNTAEYWDILEYIGIHCCIAQAYYGAQYIAVYSNILQYTLVSPRD